MSVFLRRLLSGVSASAIVLTPIGARSNPLNGSVVGGSATISGQGTNTVTVDQSSGRAIVNWQSFNVAPGETTQFVQPNASSVILNRVTGNFGASTINGVLKANGGVYIVNPDGILFGPSAKVNVGSFLGTTHDTTNADFMAGKNKFTIHGNPSASIVNQGRITASSGGFAALVAPGVRNDGVIVANLGKVALTSANGFSLDLYGDNLIKLQPSAVMANKVVDVATGKTIQSLVQNTGTIRANGGKVMLTAAAAKHVMNSVINSSGVIEANTVGTRNGMVVFGAATTGGKHFAAKKQIVRITGTVDTIARKAGTTAGTIQITGGNVQLASAKLNAWAQTGGSGLVETSGTDLSVGHAKVHSGQWVIDPYDLTVDSTAASTIDHALNMGTNVALQTTASGTSGPGNPNSSGSGDILINSPLTWTSTATLSLSAYRDIDFNASVTASGGGSLALMTGTGGNGGDYHIATGSNISFTGGPSSGSGLSINGQSYTLLYDINSVQNINANGPALSGYYALAIAIDASGALNWMPIGTDGVGNISNNGAGFSGVFAGLGNTISNLTVNLPNANYVGLFGYSSGTLRDVDVSVQSVNGHNYTAGLVGFNAGTILNSSVSGNAYSLDGINGLNNLGGLAGENTGAISGSFAAVSVLDSSVGTDVGGLVGYNTGQISNSYESGIVADTDTAEDPGQNIGGLVGQNSGQITNAYATGSIAASGGTNIGGLVGLNSGTLTDVIAIGRVGGSLGTAVGGLVGYNNKGTIINGYWIKETTGQSTGIGSGTTTKPPTGLSMTSGPSPFSASSYSGLNFSNGGIWNIVSGLSFPYLQSQFPTGTPQVISGIGSRAPNLAPDSTPYPYLYGFSIGGLVDGKTIGQTSMGYNGFYDFLVAPGTISSAGSQVLTYIVGSISTTISPGSLTFYNPTGNSFMDNATGSVTGLNIYGHYVALYSGASTITAIAQDLATAQGTQSSSDFIFSIGNGPNYTLNIVDPAGLPSGSSIALYSTAQNFNIDQFPTLHSSKDFVNLNMLTADATLTQSVAINAGRMSLEGVGTTYNLTNAANSIDQLAADTGIVNLTDTHKLVVAQVSLISGITADTFVLNDAAGAGQSVAIDVSNLLLRGSGANFALKNSRNMIGALSANTYKIELVDDSSLVIGSINGLNGVSVTDLSVKAIGNGSNIIIQNSISTSSLTNLEPTGTLTESGNGSIQAKKLEGSSVGGTSLNGTNLIGTLGDFTNNSSGDFLFSNAQPLSVSGALAEQPSGTITLTTTIGKIAIGKGGVLNGNTVTLNSAENVGEASSGRVDANLLNVTANTGIALVGNNNIGNVGADHTNSGPNKINK